jgi:CRISPR-associated protein Csm1
MDRNIYSTALAGLMHDIGKFAQRARSGLTETWDEKALTDFKYQHALASHTFVTKNVPRSLHGDLSGVPYHHHPQSEQDYWVQLADHLSSAEREEDEDNRLPRLKSIFSNLSNHTQDRFVPLTRLNPLVHGDVFPVSTIDPKMTDRQYEKLWGEFEAACQSAGLPANEDITSYLETFYSLMQDFTWCVPAAYWKTDPDISLFDHARTTAALAACLAVDERKEDWCKSAKGTQEEVCLLVAGDLSGVQRFIYSITSGGAAKSLRARSFYVQLISEALALALMRKVDVPITNLLYVGGGGFQALLPMKAAEGLQDIAKDMSNRLLITHQGSLGLTLCWTAVKADEFDRIYLARERLGKHLNFQKRQPFQAASADILASVIGQPITQGGDPLKYCQVTGEDGEHVHQDKDGVYKSDFVLSLEELGKQLPKATHIVLGEIPFKDASQAINWQQALQTFGLKVEIVTGKKVAETQLDNPSFTRIWRLEPHPKAGENDWLAPFLRMPHVISYRPFARLTPLDRDGDPKTTDDLAKPMYGKFERWGVLRMDVDNLGRLFRVGFGKSASLSRVASLSFALRLFFEGWLPRLAKGVPDLAKGDPDLSPHLYLQYAGGDDIFIIGSWDTLPIFAQRVQNSFKDYTCDNPAISISGGISLAEAGFPLYQAALSAGDAEEQAKLPRPDGNEKNAIHFMDTTVSWDTFEQIRQEVEKLAKGIENGSLPRSLLQTLLSLYASMLQAQRDARRLKRKKPIFGSWTWMAAYQLTRQAQDAKGEENKTYIYQLRDRFLIPNTDVQSIALAARWAQFLTRGG